MGAVAGTCHDVKQVLHPGPGIGDSWCLVEATVISTGAAQIGDTGDARLLPGIAHVRAEQLAAQVTKIEMVRHAIEVNVDNRDAAWNGPLHLVGGQSAPDQIATFSVDDINSVTFLILCRTSVLRPIMVLWAIPATKDQRRHFTR